MVVGVFIPYIWACGMYRGYLWKGAAFYMIAKSMDALYDIGMYLRFFIHGPKYFKSILSLDDNKSFSVIQARLFMKYCAEKEMKKAKGEIPHKRLTELAMVKSVRNQLRDMAMQWKNSFGYINWKIN
jgi:hypothetical protein